MTLTDAAPIATATAFLTRALNTPLTAPATLHRNAVAVVPHTDLYPWANQPRKHFDEDALKRLALSIYNYTERDSSHITETGILVPLIARPTPTGLEIAAGERRYRAVKLLIEGFWVEIPPKTDDQEAVQIFCQVPSDYPMPVQIRELSDAEMREVALIENMQREELSELEEADLFVACRSEGLTPEDIAQRYSIGKATVERRLLLGFGLGRDGRRLLEAGQITLSHAYILANTTGPLKQTLIKAAKSGMSVKDMRAVATRGSVLVKHAEFDVQASGLSFAPKLLDDGLPERFDDPKAALAYQLNALNAKAEAHAQSSGTWAEVVGVDGNPRILPDAYVHQGYGPKGRVYAYSLTNGQAVIHDDVYRASAEKPAVKAAPQPGSPTPQSAPAPREEAESRLAGYRETVKVYAESVKTAALADALMQHPHAGLVNAIIMTMQRTVSVSGMSVAQKKEALSVQTFAQAVAERHPDLFISYSPGTLNFAPGVSTSQAFYGLLKWEAAALLPLLTFLTCGSAYADDKDYTRTVAEFTGASALVQERFNLSAELLEAHSQAGLHALHHSIDEDVRPIVEPEASKKELKAVLLEKAPLLKQAGWLPEYAKF